MPNLTTPETPRDFAETMIRSSIEADRLFMENINDRQLREAHSHSAVNGYIAAMAMEALRRFAPDAAGALAMQLKQTLTAGDLGGPAYRVAKALGHDPDQWIAEFDDRAALRRTNATGSAS